MKLTKEDFQYILSDVHYCGWDFFIGEDGDRYYLQLAWQDEDCDTGQVETMTSRKWVLSPHMTRSEVVQTALKAVLTAVEHEVRERFKYQGQAIFGPHFDVDVLARMAAYAALVHDKRERAS